MLLIGWDAAVLSSFSTHTLILYSAASPSVRAGGAQQQRNEQTWANVKLWTLCFLGILLKLFCSVWQGCNSWGEGIPGIPSSVSCLPGSTGLSEATSPVSVITVLVGARSYQRFPGWPLSLQAVHSHQVAHSGSGGKTGHYTEWVL